ncbi:hypothetical protein TWF730_006632 [Orbilia blumenaviensis]|uniref:Nucleoside phosphorylase domain-containing protein n=1 Tax=Orbilia blumenaviensis TaxID=1796055 RepID=A0AAV9VEU8_9PEZI
MTTKKLKYEDYTVGWVTVLDSELNASILLLDEEHEPLAPKENDDNGYILGRIGAHNVAISFSGAGAYETNAAAHAVNNMLRTFPNTRFALLVGVGGGAPGPPNLDDPSQDIRLGDIVISEPKGDHGGVIQYDMGKWEDEEEFTIKSHLNKPPNLLLKAVKFLRSNHSFNKGEMSKYIEEATKKASDLPKLKGYRYPGCDQDRLFEATYRHAGENDCSNCDSRMIQKRSLRESKHTPEVHYGLIASADTVMKSAQYRDKLRNRWNVSCFDTEAAGLMNNFPCVVIRGICDYSDGHKNRMWQPYAAIAAAAYAKDLLRVISTHEVTALPPAPSLPNLNPWHNEVDTDQRTGAITQKELITSGLKERLQGILEKSEARLLTLEENLASLSQSQDVLQKIETRLFALEEKATGLSQPSSSEYGGHFLSHNEHLTQFNINLNCHRYNSGA